MKSLADFQCFVLQSMFNLSELSQHLQFQKQGFLADRRIPANCKYHFKSNANVVSSFISSNIEISFADFQHFFWVQYSCHDTPCFKNRDFLLGAEKLKISSKQFRFTVEFSLNRTLSFAKCLYTLLLSLVNYPDIGIASSFNKKIPPDTTNEHKFVAFIVIGMHLSSIIWTTFTSQLQSSDFTHSPFHAFE